MASQGFERALDFFRFSRVAAWAAMAASLLTAFGFVTLLVILGLFFDLCIDQGRIPCYANLPSAESARFAAALQLPTDAAARKEQIKSLVESVRELNLADPALEKLAAVEEPEKLSEADRELRRDLLWMANLPVMLGDIVDPSATEEVRWAIRKNVERYGPRLALVRDVDDFGILGLVVRTRLSVHRWFVQPFAAGNEWTWKYGDTYYLQGLVLAGLTVTLLRGICFFLSNALAAKAVIESATRLRRALYLQTYRLGTLAVRSLGPSEAVGVSTRHLESVHEGMFLWLTACFREPVKFGLVLVFALLVNFWLTMIVLMLAALVWLIAGQVAAHFRVKVAAAEGRIGEELARLQESLMMMRLVKVYLMEQFNLGRFEQQLSSYADSQKSRYWGEAVYRGLFRLLGVIAATGALYLIGRALIEGSVGLAGSLTIAVAFVTLYWPTLAWFEHRRILRRARESARVMFEFLDRPGSVGQAGDAEFLPAMTNKLDFDDVSLKEPGTGKRLLKGVSFTIKAGQKVGFVGPDDLEKHAIVYLISRFLDPSHGKIRIDRKNIREVTLDSLRAQVGTVLQHNLVFNDTVVHNIACGDPAFNLARVMEAAKIAHAHQFIQKLPKGYETVVGDLGHALSSSEKFRLALARAILRDPAILVIEEPIAPMDDDTKAIIDDTFSRILPGRTVIFLPHRLSTLKSCDRIYFLHEGKLAGQGDHRELLQGNDLYRHLQYLEFNEFAGMYVPPTVNVPDVKL